MSYACVRTDNMSGTNVGKDVISGLYKVSTTLTAIENGNVVLVGDLDTGYERVFDCTTPAVNSPLADIGLVASVELVKNKEYFNINEFRNEAGDIIRVYRLHNGDEFSVTADALSGADPNVGYLVELQASTKLKVVASLTEGSTRVGKIEKIEGDWIVIVVG